MTRVAAAWLLSAVLAVIVAASGYAGHRWTAARYEARIAADREAAQRAALAASEAARVTEQERRQAQERIDAQHQADMDRARRAAIAARGELDRLRAVLAARDRAAAEHAGPSGGADDAAVERELLGACAARYQGLAAEADGLAGQVSGLQDYVRDVVRPEGAQ